MVGGMHDGGGGLCVLEETTTAAGGMHPTGMHSCSRHAKTAEPKLGSLYVSN